MIPRLNKWQSGLAAVIADYADRHFLRGVSDCCTFAGACVKAVCGRETLAAFGEWTTDREALRLLKKGGGMRAVVGRVLGEEVPVGLAQPGDVGFFMDGEQEALAVNTGQVWHGTGKNGLVVIDPDAILCAWRCCGGGNG